MTQVHNSNPFQAYAKLRGDLYLEYVAERRKLSSEELRKEVSSYENKSMIGRIITRVLSDDGLVLRVRASKQVLAERGRLG